VINENVDPYIPIIEASNHTETNTEVYLFPNPAHSSVTISLHSTSFENGIVEFIDSKGQIKLQTFIVNGANEISLSNMVSGLYHVRIQSDRESLVKKLIIQ